MPPSTYAAAAAVRKSPSEEYPFVPLNPLASNDDEPIFSVQQSPAPILETGLAMATPATAIPVSNDALVLYQPQSFDVVMKDAPAIKTSQVVVTHPPAWLKELHTTVGNMYESFQHLASTVDCEYQANLETLRAQYESITSNYRLVADLFRTNDQVTEQKVAGLQATIVAANNLFAEEVWGQLAAHSHKEEVRTRAVTRLQEVAQHHKAQLDALQRDMYHSRDITRNVANWAESADGHIKKLLERQYVDPAQFDELRQFTQSIINELAIGPTDADTVLSRLKQQASLPSRVPSRAAKHERTSSVGGQSTLRRLNLSASALRRSQAANTQSAAQRQFLAAQAGGNGGSGPAPHGNPVPGYAGGPGLDRQQGPSGPPNDPDDDDGNDDDTGGRGGGPPRGGQPFRPWGTPPPRPQGGQGYFAPVVAHINPVQLNKPGTYSGKDLSKFRSWWMSVESYIDTYVESFPGDRHRINWVGSLLTEKAQTWHQQRLGQVRRMRIADTWLAYTLSLQERFTDPSEKHRNAEKMRSLKYDGDIEQYLTEIMDLNDTVEWSGVTLQTHISRILPDEITRLVYSRHGAIPSTDEEFLEQIREAGRIYENMLTNPGLLSMDIPGPPSLLGHSARCPSRLQRTPPCNPPHGKASQKRRRNIWNNELPSRRSYRHLQGMRQ